MQLAIDNLLKLGAITQCNPKKNQYLSSIFLVEKSNGGNRFILNLKSLNKFIEKTHFKMEDFRSASKLIPQNGYLATIDLKESYLLLPISPKHKHFLRFQFQPSDSGPIDTYEFTALPYGLSVAPRVFTKVIKEVMSYLRNQGFLSVNYLDDILCIGNTYIECAQNVNETIKLLQCLGFVINFEKSVLQPQKVCKFLGFVFNTQDLTLSLPDDKSRNIFSLVQTYMKLPSCSIRDFARLIGILVAACPAVKYGWVYTKILERQKYLMLKNYQNYETKVKIPAIVLDDLKWWSDNIFSAKNHMRNSDYKLEIYSDASRTGWGAVCKDQKIHGSWKASEQEYHINYLELLAAFLGLKSFASELLNCTVLLRIDNTTAISYINRMGGIQFPHLNSLSRDIWQWCEKRDLFLFASYVNTKENRADAESRRVNPDTEWELSNEAFAHILSKFGEPEIDLFASRTNAKCHVFVSWNQDPEASAIDAFTISWSYKYFYAFPPFAILLKCIRKIIDDKAEGILVFPYWPSQPWFPLLKQIMVSELFFLNPHKMLLQSHFRDCHPLHEKLTLAAVKVSGARSASAAAHQNRFR
ncbi:uncharacterized protein LOC119691092 isoform X1 [Plutella xylostella]|uniref:uncharacterized protein LOC119691092 isoform X1 n=1 Tax=Plutella xylostella TaxID=51655 RepID=UPI002032C493|nr:uncharacterized protein LOC119691092 isoform X1 [Plutella xylostella]